MAQVVLMSGTPLGVAENLQEAERVAMLMLDLEPTEVFIVGEAFGEGDVVTAVVREDPQAAMLTRAITEDGSSSFDGRVLKLSQHAPSRWLDGLPASFGRLYGDLQELRLVGLPLLESLPRSLARVSGLVVLQVERTAVRALPPLGGLLELRQLLVRQNKLTHLARLASSITALDASQNHLRTMENLDFLPKLKSLQLQENQLREVLGSHRGAALELKDFDAAGNPLREAFVRTPGLEKLSLSRTSAQAAEQMLRGLCSESLLSLSLAACSLRSLPKETWPALGALEFLDLTSNELKRLPAAACGPRLRHLLLASNMLDSLPRELGAAKNLRVLDVSNNLYLDTLPRSLGKLPFLETVLIQGCYIKRLPARCARLSVGCGGKKAALLWRD